jgi:PAP2 superfamily
MTTVSPPARLSSGLTLAGLRAALRDPQFRALLFWWNLTWLAFILCAIMRGYMDNIGLPVHGPEVERRFFGSLPTVWLQDHVYPISPGALSWAAALVHGSWFLVPWLVGLFVSWKRPQRIGSLFLYCIALHFIVNPLFAVFPLQPPWMASPEVTRLVALHFGSEIPDNNPLAAMPSLHVALPLLISVWFVRERWRTPALAMLAYTALVSLEVVFAGEHYAVDVAGAAIIVGAIVLFGRLDFRRVLSWFTARPVAQNKSPLLQPELARSDETIANVNNGPGLTSRPSVILAVTTTLIVVVMIKFALLW